VEAELQRLLPQAAAAVSLVIATPEVAQGDLGVVVDILRVLE
jgi:hypothetical protein